MPSNGIMTRGRRSTIDNVAVEDGKFRFAVDTHELFIDVKNTRIQITDIEMGYTYKDMIAIPNPLPKLYLTTDTNRFYSYDKINKKWDTVGCPEKVVGPTGPTGATGPQSTICSKFAANASPLTNGEIDMDFGSLDANG